MPELNWVGKAKVITHHLDVPYRVLDRQYSFDETGQHEADNGSANMIIHGDNLEALKALLPQFEGRVDCVYIDPPYNTGNEGWIYNDNVNDPRIKKWLGDVVGKEGEDLSRHDKWLSMMYPRLRLLHRVLAPAGVIFISIDDNEFGRLLEIMNEIFGERNRLGVFVQDKANSKSDTGDIQRNHEYVIAFRKHGVPSEGNSSSLADISETLKEVEQDDTGWFRLGDPITTRADGGVLSARPNLGFSIYYNEQTGDFLPVEDYDKDLAENPAADFSIYTDVPELICGGYIPIRPPKVRGQLGAWTWRLDKVAEESRNLFVKKTRTGFQVRKRISVPASSVIQVDGKHYEVSREPSNARSILRFPTKDGTAALSQILGDGAFNNPKNPRMLEYLIGLTGNPDAIVLDSFAGSGTTAEAVMRLNKNDNGNRTFILIELDDYAETVTARRAQQLIVGYSAKKPISTKLFEQRLTLTSLRKASELIEEAQSVANQAAEKYDKVQGPTVENGILHVTASSEVNTEVEGLGGSFSFYELGEPLLVDGSLNAVVPVDRVREYIWFTETQTPLQPSVTPSQPFYLGTHKQTAYHFIYEPDRVTNLGRSYVASLSPEVVSDAQVIYADTCTLSVKELSALNVTFKKIPRDITRL